MKPHQFSKILFVLRRSGGSQNVRSLVFAKIFLRPSCVAAPRGHPCASYKHGAGSREGEEGTREQLANIFLPTLQRRAIFSETEKRAKVRFSVNPPIARLWKAKILLSSAPHFFPPLLYRAILFIFDLVNPPWGLGSFSAKVRAYALPWIAGTNASPQRNIFCKSEALWFLGVSLAFGRATVLPSRLHPGTSPLQHHHV